MSRFILLLAVAPLFTPPSALAQAGTEYAAGLSTSAALANKLGKKLSDTTDTNLQKLDREIKFPGDDANKQPQGTKPPPR